jgi:iron complex outermembrane receptor protein
MMMNFKKTTFLIFVFFLHLMVNGQSIDSLNTLENVEVMDTRAKQYSIGYKVNELDKSLLKSFVGNSISDVLTSASNVNIKSYGPGGLSSISIRGGSPNHTAVLWNGINLQSPMNGGLNLSALPMDLLGDVSLQMGGSGALVGSGAAFGVLRLSSSSILEKKNSAFISTSVGSFSNYRGALGTNFYLGNSIFSIKGFYQESENDFEFVNTAKFGSPTEKQTNSAFNQYGFVLDNKTLINENLVFLGSVFYSEYDKDIQTLMSDYKPSEANQVDRNVLISSIFKYSKDKLNLNFKNAFIDAKLDYTDPSSVDSESVNKSNSFISELESTYTASENQSIYSALNYTYETAQSSGYIENPNRNRFSAIAIYKLTNIWERINMAFSLREEVIDSDFTPLQYSVGVDGDILSFLSFNYNLGKVYRIPTMNDLFWKETGFAVGNPNLVNEFGYTTDFGLVQDFKLGALHLKLEQTVYYNEIDNLIVWQPRSSDGKWEPINKNKGRAKGVELGITTTIELGLSELGIKESYAYNDATTTDDNGKTWQRQVYSPEHNSNTSVWWKYKDLRANFLLNYYSLRNVDNSGNTLPAYTLGDFSLGYSFITERLRIDLTGKINNIWDTQYQVTNGYAMPLRNYMVSAKFSIN